ALPFLEGDAFHPPENRQKIASGHPLNDADRWPWLDALNKALRQSSSGAVLACSALTAAYRTRLSADLNDVRWLLLDAPPEVIRERLAHRVGHFAGPELLPSQLALLDAPSDAVWLDATKPVAAIVAEAVRRLGEISQNEAE